MKPRQKYLHLLEDPDVGRWQDGDKRREEVRIGPPGASVDNLKIKWEMPKGDFKEFTILR
ncbi:MAG: hypothetical protein QXO54_02775 [Candidatus Methanomethylicaceae archaeon]|nr:hypothetical protein [Candidatus Verstraetearchaeota archaeon]MDI9644845.1 hypothetical protein [Candidatus Verstraetearchaeota archaeon]